MDFQIKFNLRSYVDVRIWKGGRRPDLTDFYYTDQLACAQLHWLKPFLLPSTITLLAFIPTKILPNLHSTFDCVCCFSYRDIIVRNSHTMNIKKM